MKAESMCKCKNHHASRLDTINNVVTFVNAVGVAIISWCMLCMQSQIKSLFDREGDTAIKVYNIEKTLESAHSCHKSTTNTVTHVDNGGAQ